MAEYSFSSHEYIFHVQDWRDITIGIEQYIASLSDGHHVIRVSYERDVLAYSIKYFYGKTCSLTDETANLEVLRVDRYTGSIPSFRTQPLQEERRYIQEQYLTVLQQGVLTAEMQSYVRGERATYVSPSKLLVPFIKKVAPAKLFGGFFSLWQSGEMGSNYSAYQDAYRAFSDTGMSEEERRNTAAASTITGKALQSLRCVPVYVSDKGSYIAALFKKQ